MQNKFNAFILGALALAVLAIVTVVAATQSDFLSRFRGQGPATSFEDCLKVNGSRVLETSPRQCVVGKYTYVETLSQTPAPTEDQNVIELDQPDTDAPLKSPVTVSGYAPGTWFFEGSFPVELQDDTGKVLATGVAQAKGEWMTEDMVEFSAKLSFTKPATSEGRLVFRKDNPSGLPQNDQEVTVPVIF